MVTSGCEKGYFQSVECVKNREVLEMFIVLNVLLKICQTSFFNSMIQLTVMKVIMQFVLRCALIALSWYVRNTSFTVYVPNCKHSEKKLAQKNIYILTEK